jgi:hypothetical protein
LRINFCLIKETSILTDASDARKDGCGYGWRGVDGKWTIAAAGQ